MKIKVTKEFCGEVCLSSTPACLSRNHEVDEASSGGAQRDHTDLSKIRIISAIIFLFSFFILHSRVALAAPRYPIPELGYCRDSRECFFYCQIPKNTPACWSYGKFILQKSVLGEATESAVVRIQRLGITFPIAELGNCANVSECKNYCSQTGNAVKCHDFALKKGLIQEQDKPSVGEDIIKAGKSALGCADIDSCKAFCQKESNIDSCHAFAVKHKLARSEDAPKQITSAILKVARKEFGCSDVSSCRSFCENAQNKDRCLSFGKAQKLIKEEPKESEQKRRTIVSKAQEELGCDSYNACAELCKLPENSEKCTQFSHKFITSPTPMVSTQILRSGQSQGPGGCATEKTCQEYCSKNPRECAGYVTQTESLNSILKITPSETTRTQSGDFVGPGGCKTESECRDYCQKHPTECPGFTSGLTPTHTPEIEAEQETENETAEPTRTTTVTINPSPTRTSTSFFGSSGSSPSNTPYPSDSMSSSSNSGPGSTGSYPTPSTVVLD